jgi:Uma2 family endonuclease
MTPDAAQQFEYMSLDDFEELLLDKPRDEKWELIGGRVIRGMVGARWEHKEIVLNITTALRNHFRAAGSPCRAYDETFWLKEKSLDLKVFPDVLVFCRKLTEGATSIHDPVVLIEVLSKGTEQRDRLEKWELYQRLPTLQHYALVERDKPRVEVFSRPGAEWSQYAMLKDLHDILSLPAIDFKMQLSEIYRDVFT